MVSFYLFGGIPLESVLSSGYVGCAGSCGDFVTYVYFQTDIFELEGVPKTKAQIKVLKIKSIVLEDVEAGHGISKQSLRHSRCAKGLEDTRHVVDGAAARGPMDEGGLWRGQEGRRAGSSIGTLQSISCRQIISNHGVNGQLLQRRGRGMAARRRRTVQRRERGGMSAPLQGRWVLLSESRRGVVREDDG